MSKVEPDVFVRFVSMDAGVEYSGGMGADRGSVKRSVSL